jgi:hypothetical protein
MTKPPAEYGFLKLALVILMVVLVHFVEAYMLNPAIYSAALKLHPLMVSMHLGMVVHTRAWVPGMNSCMLALVFSHFFEVGSLGARFVWAVCSTPSAARPPATHRPRHRLVLPCCPPHCPRPLKPAPHMIASLHHHSNAPHTHGG